MNKEKKIKLILISMASVLLLLIVFIGIVIFDIGDAKNNLAKSNKLLPYKNPLSAPAVSPVPALTRQITLDEQVETILNKMSDEEKIGQLLIVGLDSTHMDDNARKLIQKYHVGGFILFDRNMQSPAQTATLVNQLQKETLKQKISLPLFICIDQEGGVVMRMKDKVSDIPSQDDLAKNGKPIDARIWAEKSASELQAMGINVNFAPVVDLGANYKRSYSTDPAIVENFAREALNGYRQKGILACLKHFPGIGKAKIDPHEDTSFVDADRKELEENDILPFKNLIRDLDNQTFFVMVSHLKYSAYDNKLPASLSEFIMKDLLRENLRFTGLIVTDDMEMGALTKIYSFEEMGYMSIKAGADIALVCHDFNSQIAVYNSLMNALKGGSLSKETLNDRVRRIIKNKLTKIQYNVIDATFAEKFVGK